MESLKKKRMTKWTHLQNRTRSQIPKPRRDPGRVPATLPERWRRRAGLMKTPFPETIRSLKRERDAPVSCRVHKPHPLNCSLWSFLIWDRVLFCFVLFFSSKINIPSPNRTNISSAWSKRDLSHKASWRWAPPRSSGRLHPSPVLKTRKLPCATFVLLVFSGFIHFQKIKGQFPSLRSLGWFLNAVNHVNHKHTWETKVVILRPLSIMAPPWLGRQRICLQCRRPGFRPWVGKIPWQWLPTLVFLPGGFHGQRSLAGYTPRGHKESDMTEQHKQLSLDKLTLSKVESKVELIQQAL